MLQSITLGTKCGIAQSRRIAPRRRTVTPIAPRRAFILTTRKTTFTRATGTITPTLFTVTKLPAASRDGRLCLLHTWTVITAHGDDRLANRLGYCGHDGCHRWTDLTRFTFDSNLRCFR
jgi:hypothetical protein